MGRLANVGWVCLPGSFRHGSLLHVGLFGWVDGLEKIVLLLLCVILGSFDPFRGEGIGCVALGLPNGFSKVIIDISLMLHCEGAAIVLSDCVNYSFIVAY